MTENDKQEILRDLTTVLTHLKQQLDTEEEQAIQGRILNELMAGPKSGLSANLLPFSPGVPATILERETQINRVTQTIDYIRQTEASALTDEGIRTFSHSVGQ